MKVFVTFFSTLLIAILFLVKPALATLGEHADSITADRKALSAVESSKVANAGYTVQEIKSDSSTVREYISPDNIVFGIAWTGLVPPDLNQLLGRYNAGYREKLNQAGPTPGRRFSEIKTDQIVVESWGHMRHFQGRAYVPALIPSGVCVDEIK